MKRIIGIFAKLFGIIIAFCIVVVTGLWIYSALLKHTDNVNVIIAVSEPGYRYCDDYNELYKVVKVSNREQLEKLGTTVMPYLPNKPLGYFNKVVNTYYNSSDTLYIYGKFHTLKTSEGAWKCEGVRKFRVARIYTRKELLGNNSFY